MRRFALFVAFTILGVWLSLSLGGCAPVPQKLEGSGIRAPAPQGHVDLCKRDPENVTCPKKNADQKRP